MKCGLSCLASVLGFRVRLPRFCVCVCGVLRAAGFIRALLSVLLAKDNERYEDELERESEAPNSQL